MKNLKFYAIITTVLLAFSYTFAQNNLSITQSNDFFGDLSIKVYCMLGGLTGIDVSACKTDIVVKDDTPSQTTPIQITKAIQNAFFKAQNTSVQTKVVYIPAQNGKDGLNGTTTFVYQSLIPGSTQVGPTAYIFAGGNTGSNPAQTTVPGEIWSTFIHQLQWGNAKGDNADISNINASNTISANLVSVNASTSNLFASNASLSSATSVSLFSNFASITNSTSTNIYSLFANLVNLFFTNASGTNATITNATSTNIFALNASLTNGTSTNLFAVLFNALSASVDNLIFKNATGGNATTSNFATTNLSATGTFALATGTVASATISNLVSNNATITKASIINATATSLFANSASFTQSTSTNLYSLFANFANLLATKFVAQSATLTNATSTNLFTTNLNSSANFSIASGTIASTTIQNLSANFATLSNATISNLMSTNASLTNATTTSLFSSIFSAMDVYFTNLTATNATFTSASTTNLSIGSVSSSGGILYADANGVIKQNALHLNYDETLNKINFDGIMDPLAIQLKDSTGNGGAYLEIFDGTNADVAQADSGRIIYDPVSGKILGSVNGSAYAELLTATTSDQNIPFLSAQSFNASTSNASTTNTDFLYAGYINSSSTNSDNIYANNNIIITGNTHLGSLSSSTLNIFGASVFTNVADYFLLATTTIVGTTTIFGPTTLSGPTTVYDLFSNNFSTSNLSSAFGNFIVNNASSSNSGFNTVQNYFSSFGDASIGGSATSTLFIFGASTTISTVDLIVNSSSTFTGLTSFDSTNMNQINSDFVNIRQNAIVAGSFNSNGNTYLGLNSTSTTDIYGERLTVNTPLTEINGIAQMQFAVIPNLFASSTLLDNATSTNWFTSNFMAENSSTIGLTFKNGTGTNATITSLVVDNLFLTGKNASLKLDTKDWVDLADSNLVANYFATGNFNKNFFSTGRGNENHFGNGEAAINYFGEGLNTINYFGADSTNHNVFTGTTEFLGVVGFGTSGPDTVLLGNTANTTSLGSGVINLAIGNSSIITIGNNSFGGNFTVNLPSSFTNDLSVDGCVTAGGSTLGGTCFSDKNLKENIEEIATSSLLTKIGSLKFVTYNWNIVAKELYKRPIDKRIAGVIAQDVEAQFPEFVSTDVNGYKQVNFSSLQWYLFAAIKELNNKVDYTNNKVINFADIVVNKITAKEVVTDKLCIKDTCINQDDLKDFLKFKASQNAKNSQNTISNQTPAVDTPTAINTPVLPLQETSTAATTSQLTPDSKPSTSTEVVASSTAI